jgi:hypothetical protein
MDSMVACEIENQQDYIIKTECRTGFTTRAENRRFGQKYKVLFDLEVQYKGGPIAFP